MIKSKSKKKSIINIVVAFLKNMTTIKKEIILNHEYKTNIGTLYKGSSEESNTVFRFKERFRKKDGVFECDVSRLCMEAI